MHRPWREAWDRAPAPVPVAGHPQEAPLPGGGIPAGACAAGARVAGSRWNIEWKGGRLVSAVLRSLNGSAVRLRYRNATRDVQPQRGESVRWNGR